MLADASTRGCAEAVLRAHGFDPAMLAELINAGFVSVCRNKCEPAGVRSMSSNGTYPGWQVERVGCDQFYALGTRRDDTHGRRQVPLAKHANPGTRDERRSFPSQIRTRMPRAHSTSELAQSATTA
jgi:hypothetical protein